MFWRRRRLLLLRTLGRFLPRLPHHLRTRDLLWRLSLRTLFVPRLHWRWSLFAFNLLRHALHFGARGFSLHLLLRAATYSLTLRLLSLLLSLRLLRYTLRLLHLELLFSLLLLELLRLPPRVLVALSSLGSKLCYLLFTRSILLVAGRIYR